MRGLFYGTFLSYSRNRVETLNHWVLRIQQFRIRTEYSIQRAVI